MGTHVSFIFRGYNQYIGGSKPSFFMVLGSKGGTVLILSHWLIGFFGVRILATHLKPVWVMVIGFGGVIWVLPSSIGIMINSIMLFELVISYQPFPTIAFLWDERYIYLPAQPVDQEFLV